MVVVKGVQVSRFGESINQSPRRLQLNADVQTAAAVVAPP